MSDDNVHTLHETSEEVQATLKEKFEKAKAYVKANAEPIAVGALAATCVAVLVVRGKNANKDLLVLRRKQLKRMMKSYDEGKRGGVEYNVKGTRLWLIPALLPESETPYV